MARPESLGRLLGRAVVDNRPRPRGSLPFAVDPRARPGHSSQGGRETGPPSAHAPVAQRIEH